MPIIEEQVFRQYNLIENPISITWPKVKKFTENTVLLDPNLSITQTTALNDTCHDLAKDRKNNGVGYSAVTFNENGPANYLMIGEMVRGNLVTKYKDAINNQHFNNNKRFFTSFESNVANSIEIEHMLQPAEVAITYDEVIKGISNTYTIKQTLYAKVKKSNNSLRLHTPEGNSFAEYYYAKNSIFQIQEYIKISKFIHWYLHGQEVEQEVEQQIGQQIEQDYIMKIPTESMKILADAGVSFMKEFFSVSGSNVTPFIAIPCLLDSASTSLDNLDPSIDKHFETFKTNLVPIVSNYFTSDKYFFCYILYPNDYNYDNIYNFSLNICKIDKMPDINDANTFKELVDIVRNTQSIVSKEYIEACNKIHEYIVSYPGLVTRYKFGEIKKDYTNDSSESNSGTCGAGVPYLGKVMNTIITLSEDTRLFNKIDNKKYIVNPHGISTIKAELNKFTSVKGKIPMANIRLLNMFKYSNTQNEPIQMTRDDLLTMLKIIADYKRTGDYQQAYTVLKEIIYNNGNVKCFTFCSGDELSALIGRLLGVPTIYQTSGNGTCCLYSCNYFTATEDQIQQNKEQQELNNKLKVIQTYIRTFNDKITSSKTYVVAYDRILKLRNSLLKALPNYKLMTRFKVLYAIQMLGNLQELILDFTKKLGKIQQYIEPLQKAITYKDIMTIEEAILKIEADSVFELYKYTLDKFNGTSLDDLLLTPVKYGTNINKPLFGLNIIRNVDKQVQGLDEYYETKQNPNQNQRNSPRFDQLKKTNFESGLKTLLDSIDFEYTDKINASTIEEYYNYLLIQFKIPQNVTNDMIQEGGSQTGGSDITQNIRVAQADVKNLIFRTLTRCSMFANNIKGKELDETIKELNETYNTKIFCKNILFDDGDEHTSYDETIGLLNGLKIVADDYYYSDFGLNGGDKCLTVYDLLIRINAVPVLNTILLLSLQQDYYDLVLTFIGIPDGEEKFYENIIIQNLGQPSSDLFQSAVIIALAIEYFLFHLPLTNIKQILPTNKAHLCFNGAICDKIANAQTNRDFSLNNNHSNARILNEVMTFVIHIAIAVVAPAYRKAIEGKNKRKANDDVLPVAQRPWFNDSQTLPPPPPSQRTRQNISQTQLGRGRITKRRISKRRITKRRITKRRIPKTYIGYLQ